MDSGDEGRRFTYRQVEDLVGSIHGTGASPTALLGRFKYFQRLGFPGGSNTGRGSRAAYDVGQIVALALAFELLETGMPPVRVVRIVRTAWPKVAPAMALSWARSPGPAAGAGRVMLAMVPAALGEMGSPEDVEAPSPDELVVLRPSDVAGWLDAGPGEGAASVLLVDPARIVSSVSRELGGLLSLAGVDPSLDDAFLEWGVALFGSSDPSRWSLDLAAAEL